MKNFIKKLVRILYISDFLHLFLAKTGLLNKFKLLGFGDQNIIELTLFYDT